MYQGMATCRLMGLNAAITQLRVACAKKGVQGGVGIRKAALWLFRKSSELVPVEFGVLKASEFLRTTGWGWRTRCYIGYTAVYAIYVHENLEALHGQAFNDAYADKIAKVQAGKGHSEYKRQWSNRGPNQCAKFLERPARAGKKEMLAIIVGEVRG